MTTPLLTTLRKRLVSGETTPTQVLMECLRHIRHYDDPALFISLRSEHALQRIGEELEAKGPADLPLYGIPFAVKDNIDVAGLETTAGCPGYAYMPSESAEAVRLLEAAGAVVIGKTNLDQFATGLVGTRSPYGIPRNPVIPGRIPGGSSSGSGAAVAAGLVPFSLGTDTAGSGRVPAGACNIVGLKPTPGLVSTRGVVPAVRGLDCVSIFAGSAADAKSVLDIIGTFDKKDPYSRRAPSSATSTEAPRTIGILTDEHLDAEPAQREAYEQTVNILKRSGCTVKPIDYGPFAAAAHELYGGPWVAWRTAAVGDVIDKSIKGLDPTVSAIVSGGKNLKAVDAWISIERIATLKRTVADVWAQVEAILLPTAPCLPTLEEVAADPVGVNTRLGTYTNFVNLLDCSAFALPAPQTVEPVGNTLIGPAWRDGQLAALAAEVHPLCSAVVGATNEPIPLQKFSKSSTDEQHMLLAVCGAHLSGMPLEHQLTDRGATLIQRAQTSKGYRLFALADTNPAKPGLVRDANGESIEVEVWRVPKEHIGSFLAEIPYPLGLGSIELADGRWVTGFTCDNDIARKGSDITCHGGWRAYISSRG